MNELKREICLETNWNDIEYQRVVNMGFITIIKNGNICNIQAIIIMATANIIAYTYNSINKLEGIIRGVRSVINAFEKAIDQDTYLTTLHNFPTYTNRLRIAPDVNTTIQLIDTEIARYNNSLVDLPRINHIVYPNIQYFKSLAIWLKSHNVKQTLKDMAIAQQVALDIIEYDNLNNGFQPENLVLDYSETVNFII